MSNAVIVQGGLCVDYTPSGDVSSGDVVVQGDLVGVAPLDIDADAKGALQVSGGVIDFPKDSGSGTAITAGAKVYWDDDNDVATDTAGSNKTCGLAVEAASDDDTYVRVAQIVT